MPTDVMRATTIRVRLLAALMAVALVSAVGLALYFLTELEDFGLRKLEERLESEARVTGALTAALLQAEGVSADTEALHAVEAGAIEEALREASARLPSRIIVVDAQGVSVADSAESGETGRQYAGRIEVASALQGNYGAATRMTETGRVALYIAVPIRLDGVIVGASYSSATTFSITSLLDDYRTQAAGAIALFLLGALVLTELISRWLSRPLAALAGGVAAFAAGDRTVRVAPAGARETREVAVAFNTLAERTEQMVEELQAEERRKTRFVSDVSHELRTPLTAIRGAAETLLEGDVPEDDAREFLETIAVEAQRLGRLATDLIALQRIEGATGEIPLARVDLAAVASAAVRGLAPLLEERGVEVEIVGVAPTVLGDRDRLQQVVANLVDNASRVTPREGTVRVALASLETAALRRAGEVAGGDSGADARGTAHVPPGQHALVAELRVTDKGPGIADEDLPYVFERFYRAQASRDRGSGGAGLGLSIVAAIVAQHRGVVWAENTAARTLGVTDADSHGVGATAAARSAGASFVVRLPGVGDGQS